MALAVVMGLVASLLGARAALAQDAEMKARARDEVKAGMTAQDLGQLDAAIEHYGKAYELVPHPELLFNLGQVHRLKGDASIALGYYRKYLAVDGKGRLARAARDLVKELEPLARAEEQRKAEDAKQAEAARAAREAEEAKRNDQQHLAEQARAAQAARAAEQALAAQAARRAEERRWQEMEARRRTRRKISLGLGATAIAVLGTSLAFELWGQSGYSDYEDAPGGPAGDRLYDQANARHQVAQGLLVTGLACGAAAGALWFFSKKPEDRERRTRAAPLVAPGVAGVAIMGGF